MTDTKDDGLTIKQRADAEAARAEAENPDEEPAEPAEPAEPDDGDEAAEEEDKPAEPQAKGRKTKGPKEQFEDALGVFARKLKGIFEVDDLVPAPHPGVVGFMLPGFAEPRTHDNYRTCATCNGIGEVLTGAVTGKHEKDWHVCPDSRCKGNGYWTKTAAVQQPPQTGPLAVTSQPAENGEYAEAPAWMGDPNLSAGA